MKYNIIYADPPWRYQDKGCNGNAASHYETMCLEELKQLPIREISDKNCILFLWIIDCKLPWAFEVMKAWNFVFKTVAFTWIKENRDGTPFLGIGYWTRSNPEMCLLGTKGQIKRIGMNVPQLVFSKRREHSRKPDEVRNRIVELVGDLPRIELFARERFDGWDCWGDEISSTIQKLIN